MSVKIQTQERLIQDLKNLSQQAGSIENPDLKASGDFSSVLEKTINQVNSLQSESADLRERYQLGDKNVSLVDVMLASQKSSVTFTGAIEVRNKILEAYKEIMNMPV